MSRVLIHNATLVNEGEITQGSLVIENGRIAEILTHGKPLSAPCDELVDASDCYLLPGVIDDHVHFRDPGLTHKADIHTESCAAAAGGVTSIMDMPNTLPQTTTLEALEQKQELMAEKSLVNYSCYFGATDSNYKLFHDLDVRHVCGIKLFLGSSTGNMLVSQHSSLIRIFTSAPMLIAAHCENPAMIEKNAQMMRHQMGNQPIPIFHHAMIRSVEACLSSSQTAIELAQMTHARLHLLHISTSKELRLLSALPLDQKHITAEACVGHLWFAKGDHRKLGTLIKVNTAIKNTTHRDALRKAVNEGRIDVIATDHAPHLLADKEGDALTAASGMPMVQFSLPLMLELVDRGFFTLETVVEKMCHAPARLFQISERGYLREGYRADLVLVSHGKEHKVTRDEVLSKCKWSPLEGTSLHWSVEKTWVNGQMVFDGQQVDTSCRGEALEFDR